MQNPAIRNPDENRSRADGPALPAPPVVPESVVARLRNGEVAALSELYAVFGDRIYNTCRRITGSASDAEDATQEVFLRVLDQAKNFRGHCSFTTWVYRVAVNHTINLRRRDRRQQRALQDLSARRDADAESDRRDGSPAEERNPLESVLLREERAQIDEALRSLPDDQRSIVILREIEGLTYQEIADVMDLPMGTVTSRLIRGRERLSAIFQHRFGPES